MAGRTRALVALLIAVAATVLGPQLGAAQAAPAQAAGTSEPPRILLYGDSLTQGFSGDWTWRYRLWQSLTTSGQAFDFVGPRDDVTAYTTFQNGSHAYRDPRFDTDHAAFTGMTFSYSYARVSDLAASYDADVVVGQIGVNDLIREIATPQQLVDRWRAEIERARELRPGLSVVLVQLGQTWVPGVTTYDDALVALAAELDRPDARVVVTERPALATLTDTFDWLHTSAAGERKVASAVSGALARLGIGTGVARYPDVGADTRWAPVPSASVDGAWVTLTWPSVDYASSENVLVKDLSTGATGVVRYQAGTSAVLPGEPGHSYEIRLAPVKGYLETGPRSAPITVEVLATP